MRVYNKEDKESSIAYKQRGSADESRRNTAIAAKKSPLPLDWNFNKIILSTVQNEDERKKLLEP